MLSLQVVDCPLKKRDTATWVNYFEETEIGVWHAEDIAYQVKRSDVLAKLEAPSVVQNKRRGILYKFPDLY